MAEEITTGAAKSWQCNTCRYNNDLPENGQVADDARCARCNAPKKAQPRIPVPLAEDNLENTPVEGVKALAAASGIEGTDKMLKADAIKAVREIAGAGDLADGTLATPVNAATVEISETAHSEAPAPSS